MVSRIDSLRTKLTGSNRQKTPTILQMEVVECGAASLAMILAYHGLWVPLEELRLQCGVSRDGSKASNILKAARTYGLVAKGFKKEPQQLREMKFPMIIFWNFNHFVVLEGFKNGQVFINDPASGPTTVSDTEFDQSFTGVALTFEKGPDFKKGGQPQSVIEGLKRRFVGMKESFAFLVLVGVALVLPGLVVPVLSSTFIDKVIIGGLDYWIKPILIGLVITALIRTALSWLESYYLLRVRTQLALSSAGKFFWHVLRLPVGFYTQRSPGEISTRVGINDRVAGMLSGELARSLLALLQVVFFGTMMFFYDVYLTLITISTVVINIYMMKWIAVRTQEVNQKLSIDSGKVYSAAMNGLEVMETIKSTGGESGFFAKWAGAQAKYINSEQDVARVGLVMGQMPLLVNALNTMLIMGVGAMRVIDGHMSIGMLVAFQTLAASFTGPVQTIIGLGRQILELKGDMNRLDDVMKYPQDPWHITEAAKHKNLASTETPPQAKLQGRIEMQQLTFGYNPSGEPLIQDFSLCIEPGERVAIVGPSGCGKSTVSKLVMGLYEAWSGDILYDGKRRTDYPRQVFYNSVALVEQDVTMFEGTVRDNLTMWDTTISDQDMIQAAKDACIHDMIISRPGGYDSDINEGGANMSGGQRQRMEIARALTTNPRVLVMDEGTSALDASTEQQIDENLRRRGCTCIIIAHRLSTIRDADQILVLQNGLVVERGTHEELIQIEDGYYSRLIAQT